jgi:hypothetical protein
MLTPHDVREKLEAKNRFIEENKHNLLMPLTTSGEMTLEIYEEVLEAVAAPDCIDPRSLALAALGVEV